MPETFLTGLPTLPSPEYQFEMTEIENPGAGRPVPLKKRGTQMKNALLGFLAVLGLACTSRAQQVATVTWVNQGVNYNIPGTVAYHK
jgi:hypothetical protein